MFASASPFGQSSTSPFGHTLIGAQQGFGQPITVTNNPFAPKPFGSPITTFGAQTGSPLFGTTSNGTFGQQQSFPTFGTLSSFPSWSYTPAFGASPTPAFGATSFTFGYGSLFGQKPCFAGFGSSPSQSSPFGGTFQQMQPTFGSRTFSTTATPAFGTTTTPAFGATTAPAFGTTTPAFGTTSTPAFGATTTPAFGSTSSSLFGALSTPAFGYAAFGSSPAFGSSGTTFGVSSTPGFGYWSTPSSCTSTISAFSLGSSPSFGQTAVSSSSSPFGTTPSAFGVQTSPFGSQTTPSFGQAQFGNQAGGTRIKPYAQTPDADSTTSGTQPAGKLDSISAMPEYKDKCHEELRWEDYQRGDKGSQTAPSVGKAQFGNQAGGTRIKPYAQTPDADSTTSGTQPAGKLDSISAMPEYKDKSHEELRWEDYQRGDKAFSMQTSPFVSQAAPSFGQAQFGNQAGGTRIKRYAQTPDADSTTSGFQPAGKLDSISAMPEYKDKSHEELRWEDYQRGDKGGPNPAETPAATPSFQLPQPIPSQFTFTFPSNPGFAISSLFGSSRANNSSPFGTGLPLSNTQSAPLFQSTPALQPSSTPAFSGSLFSTPSSGSLLRSGPSLFSSTPSAPAQTSNMSFQSPIQQGGFPGFSNTTNQALVAQQTPSMSSMVMKPAPVLNPFGTLPAMSQMSIGNGGSSSSAQYGISSLPVAEKPLLSRTLSMGVPRHLSQRRIKLLPTKYNLISDSKVPFFADEEESPATPKANSFFIPRENPGNLIISPIDQWSSQNGTDRQSVPKGSADLETYKESERDKAAMAPSSRPSLVENGSRHESKAVTQGGSGSATSVERLMPKLPQGDYFTEPSVEELAAKERAEPGYCCRVKDFVVGRHGYGSIKFLGETDVRVLDLESIVEFNIREVIVYKAGSKKPAVGEGLNKAAEVTLLNVKCMNKKTGEQYHDGPRVDRYRDMLVKVVDEQGAEFVSFDAAKGEWKFRVKHFGA